MINQDQVKSVSLWETLVSKARNFSFKGLKLKFQSLETNRFIKGNTLFLGEKQNLCLSYFFACRLYLNWRW